MKLWRFFMRRESLRRKNNAENAINREHNKNNAACAIKLPRTIVHPWRPAPASVFCKDQAARQSARDACLARGSFVDRAGRSMIEYRHDLWKARARARLDSYICGTCRSCVAGSATASTPAVVTGAKAAGSLVVSLSISAGGGWRTQISEPGLLNFPANIWKRSTPNQQYRFVWNG